MTVFKNMDKSKKIILLCAAAFVILSFVACVIFVDPSGSKQIGSDQNTKHTETQKQSTKDAVPAGQTPKANGENRTEEEIHAGETPLHVFEPGSTQVTDGASSPSESSQLPAQQQPQSDSESPSDPNGVETAPDVF